MPLLFFAGTAKQKSAQVGRSGQANVRDVKRCCWFQDDSDPQGKWFKWKKSEETAKVCQGLHVAVTDRRVTLAVSPFEVSNAAPWRCPSSGWWCLLSWRHAQVAQFWKMRSRNAVVEAYLPFICHSFAIYLLIPELIPCYSSYVHRSRGANDPGVIQSHLTDCKSGSQSCSRRYLGNHCPPSTIFSTRFNVFQRGLGTTVTHKIRPHPFGQRSDDATLRISKFDEVCGEDTWTLAMLWAHCCGKCSEVCFIKINWIIYIIIYNNNNN